MKHTPKVTILLVLFFFIAQLVGLLIINQYIDHKKTQETNKIEYKPLPYNLERPEVENQSTSFIYITIAILIGTVIVLVLAKFNKGMIWKIWFFITVFITLSIAFAAFFNSIIAAVLALAFSIFKFYRPNVILQNITEIFIYGGLASIFVPILNVFGAFMLLIVISIYDYIAVFKTKHMVKMAKFQSNSKVFAGLMIPYERGKIASKPQINEVREPSASGKSEHSVAILGGGDIGFALIFAGAAMKSLMLKESLLLGFLKTMIIPIFASFALSYLLVKGQRNKFYPAMPAITIGCFIGYLVILVI